MHLRRYVGHCVNTLRKGRGVVFCVDIELASLQGLKGEPSNKIGSRNGHQYYYVHANFIKTFFHQLTRYRTVFKNVPDEINENIQ